MGYSELRPVLLKVEWNGCNKDKTFWSSHLSFVTDHWFNFHMYSISHKSKGTSLTHLSFKVRGRIKYRHIKYFINKSQKYNHSNRYSELQHMLVFFYGQLPFRKRALFLKAMIFLKGHMGTQCILQQIKSQTSGASNEEGEENGLFKDTIF